MATRALAAFVGGLAARPLLARAAADNAASIRVLEKCGFVLVGRDRGFANARGAEIEEVVMELRGAGRDGADSANQALQQTGAACALFEMHRSPSGPGC